MTQSKPTAIVIDPYPDAASLLSELLEIIGLDVLDEIKSFDQALSSFRKYLPQIVFMDVSTTEQNSIFAIEGIKKIEPTCKIVALVSDASHETIELLDRSQLDAVLIKPYTVNSVIQVLRQELKIKVSKPKK